MIMGDDLKRKIFSINKFDKKEAKSLITHKNMMYLGINQKLLSK